MRKLLLINLLLFTITVFAQDIKVTNIKPFKVGFDNNITISTKLIIYQYNKHIEIFDNGDTLIDYVVNMFYYNNSIGTLELFVGNTKLYYARFTSNLINYSEYCVNDSLFNYFKIYWD